MDESLKKAKIGQGRPLIIVGFSMGGILTKEILLLNKGEEFEKNTKSILFVSCPHTGTDVKKQTLEFWKRIVPG